MTSPLPSRTRTRGGGALVAPATALATALTIALATVLAGCGVGHPGITNGAISGCFRSLPTARVAVHDSGARLVGVHRLSADQFPRRLKTTQSLPPELDTTVCAVAFKGPFRSGQVAGAQSGAAGEYAVVLVDAKKLTVLVSYVSDRLPRTLLGRTV